VRFFPFTIVVRQGIDYFFVKFRNSHNRLSPQRMVLYKMFLTQDVRT